MGPDHLTRRLSAPRRADWPRRLDGFIRERRSRPYAYGTNDCGVWLLAWTLSATGVELLPGLVPPTTDRAAARFLLARGHRNIEGLATELLGPSLPSARLAGRGDMVSFEGGGDRHLAIVTGVVAATPGRDELLWVPRALWKRGWKI